LATTDLGFARFFFPLLKAVFVMGGNPAIRQQGIQGGGALGRKRGKASQYVGEVRPHVAASLWFAERIR